MKKDIKDLKALLLFDSPHSMPRGYGYKEEFRSPDWKTERHVYKALRRNGYKVRLIGIHDDITQLMEEISVFQPDIVFNLAEVFRQKVHLDKNIACLLEMLDVAYTGASPSDIFVCNNKGITKKILSYHGINIPKFDIIYKGHKITHTQRLKWPLIVKPLCDEASRGISGASFTRTGKALKNRVNFIHKKMDTDALVEEYIDGREFYVGVIGRGSDINVLPLIEMKFYNIPDGRPRIASYTAKWHNGYRKKYRINSVYAGRLQQGLDKKIKDVCKKAYNVLNMQGYVRFDIRVSRGLDVYILEANANPCLAADEDFSQAAKKAGIKYSELIRKIVSLGLNRK